MKLRDLVAQPVQFGLFRHAKPSLAHEMSKGNELF